MIILLRNILVRSALAGCLGSCASYAPLPLDKDAKLAPEVGQLRHDGSLPAALGIDDIVLLALQNNPELVAARAQRGVGQAQLLAAGVLPNPTASASYAFLVGGPGTGAALTAGISQDLKSLVTLSARRGAARETVKEIDAAMMWQEWQTIGRARLLTVDLIEGERQLHAQRQSASLLDDRLERGGKSLSRGDDTLSNHVPDLVAAADARKQLDDIVILQNARRRELAAFIGLAPEARMTLDESITLPPIDTAAIARSLDDLADRRPDLVALQLGYAAQEERVRGAILAQFPLFSLGVTGGRDSSDIRTLGPQITFELPLFDRNQGNIALERATREQLHDEFGARLVAARTEVLALLAEQAQLRAVYSDRVAQLAELDRIAGHAEDALRAGDLDERGFVDLVSVRNNKRLEVLAMEQDLLEQQSAIATLTGAGMPAIARTAEPAR